MALGFRLFPRAEARGYFQSSLTGCPGLRHGLSNLPHADVTCSGICIGEKNSPTSGLPDEREHADEHEGLGRRETNSIFSLETTKE